MTRMVKCIKLGTEAEGLDYQPYPGPIGEKIYNEVSKQAWQMWLSHQTMLINEYRLNMSEPTARAFLVEEMDKYFFGEGSEQPEGFKKESE